MVHPVSQVSMASRVHMVIGASPDQKVRVESQVRQVTKAVMGGPVLPANLELPATRGRQGRMALLVVPASMA